MRDIRVPVFGAVAAGKTSFLYASLISLQLDLDRSHIKWDYLDDSSRMEAESRIKEIRDGQSAIQKTGPGPAISVNLKLRDGAHADFIHLFDASGEQYSNPGNWDLVYGNQPTNYGSLRFLEDGQALAYVLDPFSVDLIRGQAAAHDQAVVARAQPAQTDPEVSYTEVLNRLRGFGVPVDAQRLAVVISKADLLRRAGLDIPFDSAESKIGWSRPDCRTWYWRWAGNSARSATSPSPRLMSAPASRTSPASRCAGYSSRTASGSPPTPPCSPADPTGTSMTNRSSSSPSVRSRW